MGSWKICKGGCRRVAAMAVVDGEVQSNPEGLLRSYDA